MAARSADDLVREHELLRTDPQAYLELMNDRIRDNPADPISYGDRHLAWVNLGRRDLALNDLNAAIDLAPTNSGMYFSRGVVLRDLGRYVEAVADFDKAFSLDEEKRLGSFGSLFRADCHARLGNEEAAVLDCADLPADHWTPGFMGLPGGSKEDVVAEFRRRAAAAREGQQ